MSAVGKIEPRKASLEIREALLRQLSVPPGAAVVARQPDPAGDVLVVRMVSSHAVPFGNRIEQFHGFGVKYEIIPPVKIKR